MDVLEMLAKIKTGVLEADWAKVIEGYRDITGETLAAPPKSPLEQLQDLIGQEKTVSIPEPRGIPYSDNPPPRPLKSNEYFDGEKIRRKPKGGKKKVETTNTNHIGLDDSDLLDATLKEVVENGQKISTDLKLCDNTNRANGRAGGTVKAGNAVFLDASALLGKKEPPKFKEEYEELKKNHQRTPRPAAKFYDVKCSTCGRESQVPASLLPPKIGKESEQSYFRCGSCAGKPKK